MTNRTYSIPAFILFLLFGLLLAGCDGGDPGDTNEVPTADFSSTTMNLTAEFTDESTDADGSIEAWEWDFGDDATSTAPDPSHTYDAAGAYTVTLTVTDDDGATDTATREITVSANGGENTSPTAAFSFSPSDPTAGASVSFTDESTDPDGEIASWDWSFGDGAFSTEQNPSHTYNAADTYEVTLTVTDDDGATGSVTQEVEVSAAGGDLEIVGTWTLQQLSGYTYLTAGLEQDIIDPDAPAEGSITLSGDLEAELTYLRRVFALSGVSAPAVASDAPVSDFGFPASPGELVQLAAPADDPQQALILANGEARYIAEQTGGITFDSLAHTLTFDDVTLLAEDGDSVRADGSVTAATQSLPAGEATRVDGFTVGIASDALVLTFEEDGTFISEETDADGNPETITGTWHIEEGALVVEVEGEEEGQFIGKRITYQVEGEQLMFEEVEEALLTLDEDDRELVREFYERIYGLQDGTLTAFALLTDFQFAASETAPAVRPALRGEEAFSWPFNPLEKLER